MLVSAFNTPDIWECKWQAVKPHGHPAEKPVDLIKKIIGVCELESGTLVLDPFMGSGTTGVAAVECGLDFIGIEYDDHWFSVAEARIRNQDEKSVVISRQSEIKAMSEEVVVEEGA